MPRRTKIQRYDDILSMPNVTVLDYYLTGEYADIRGRWQERLGNTNPITLELACGKGDYALALGSRYPEKSFIGIDVKGDRLWKGALRAEEAGLANVHFVRAQIDHLCHYFAPGEVDDIWITFPDPYLRKSKKKKRLTHPVFLKRYVEIMKPGGVVHLKTDSDQLFAFTMNIINILKLQVVRQIPDVYQLSHIPKDLDIQTYYEKQHLQNGRSIKFVSFRLNEAVQSIAIEDFDHLS